MNLILNSSELNVLFKVVSIGILQLEMDELRGEIKFKTDKKYIQLQDLRAIKNKIVELRKETNET